MHQATHQKERPEHHARRLNEEIARSYATIATERPAVLLYCCECGRRECAEAIELSPDEYEAARGRGTLFVVLPDHLDETTDALVAETERFLLVEKLGKTAKIAEQTDPRVGGQPAGDVEV